jgi:hypothetical protein
MTEKRGTAQLSPRVICRCGRTYEGLAPDLSVVCECGQSFYLVLGKVRGASGELVRPEEAHLGGPSMPSDDREDDETQPQ